MIQPPQITVIIAAINDIRVQRIGNNISGLESRRRLPITRSNPGARCPAFDPQTAVVLLRAEYMVRERVIRRHPVNLSSRLVLYGTPVHPPVEADLSAAVIRQDKTLPVLRI